jgi:hypothetical protein
MIHSPVPSPILSLTVRKTVQKTTRIITTKTVLVKVVFLCAVSVLLETSACTRQEEQRTSAAAGSTQSSAPEQISIVQPKSTEAGHTLLSKTIQVNESTLLIRLQRTYPEHVVGSASVEDVIRSLYTTKSRSGQYDTLTITDFYVAAVKGRTNVYVAVAKTLGEGADAVEQKIDVFAFQDVSAGKFLLGYASLEPEADDFSLENVSASAFQLTQAGEYAISFEYDGHAQGVNAERTRMLYFYRLHSAATTQKEGLEQVLEMCTMSKTGEAPDPSGTYQIEVTQSSSVTTQYKWGKNLYSLVIIKSESRKNDVAAGARGTQTVKTRTYLDWEDGKYMEVLQQDLGRTSS